MNTRTTDLFQDSFDRPLEVAAPDLAAPDGEDAIAHVGDDNALKLLAEIGLSAAVHGHSEAAQPIFRALSLMRPNNPIAAIGQALGDITAGRYDDAIAGLRAVGVADDACPDEVRAVLLIALCLAGQQVDAALLCRRLLDGGRGPSRQIARRLKPVIDAGFPGADARG